MVKISDISAAELMSHEPSPAYELMVRQALFDALQQVTTHPAYGQPLLRHQDVMSALASIMAMMGVMSLRQLSPESVDAFTEAVAADITAEIGRIEKEEPELRRAAISAVVDDGRSKN